VSHISVTFSSLQQNHLSPHLNQKCLCLNYPN